MKESRDVLREKAILRLGKEIEFTYDYEFEPVTVKGVIVGFEKIEFDPIVMISENDCTLINWGATDANEFDCLDIGFVPEGSALVYVSLENITKGLN